MRDVFKTLADEARRLLLDKLHARNAQTLSELASGLHMTRQAVANDVAMLEATNLVATVRWGCEKPHYLNPVPIHEIPERWIGKYERHRLQTAWSMIEGASSLMSPTGGSATADTSSSTRYSGARGPRA
jgi:DNA-binding transcriptional ArsR family regulator